MVAKQFKKVIEYRLALLVISALLAVGAIFAYELIAVNLVADKYTTQVTADIKELRGTYKQLSTTAGSALVDDPSAPIAKKSADAAKINGLITKSQAQLTTLEDHGKHLELLPYSGFTGDYKKARVLQKRTVWAVAQSRDVLDEYSSLAGYLQAYAVTQNDAQSRLDAFNAVSDLTSIYGQGAMARQTAAGLDADSKKLQQANGPDGLAQLTADTVATYTQAAAAFHQLGLALDISSDQQTDVAAQAIEAASLRLETADAAAYGKLVQQTRIVSDVQGLSEKLDIIPGMPDTAND